MQYGVVSNTYVSALTLQRQHNRNLALQSCALQSYPRWICNHSWLCAINNATHKSSEGLWNAEYAYECKWVFSELRLETRQTSMAQHTCYRWHCQLYSWDDAKWFSKWYSHWISNLLWSLYHYWFMHELARFWKHSGHDHLTSWARTLATNNLWYYTHSALSI